MTETGLEFEITATIDTKGSLKLEEPRDLKLAEADFKSISVSGHGQLKCTFHGSADTQEQAIKNVKSSLERLADLIAYEYNVPAVPIGITSWSYKDQQGQTYIGSASSFGADAVLVKPGIAAATQAPLLRLSEQKLPKKCREMLKMYRQARNEDSLAMRYILFYRILESHFGTKDKVDKHIGEKDPRVPMVKDNHGKIRSVYTDLRNKIHPGSSQALYPYGEVETQVGRLQELVRKLFQEICE